VIVEDYATPAFESLTPDQQRAAPAVDTLSLERVKIAHDDRELAWLAFEEPAAFSFTASRYALAGEDGAHGYTLPSSNRTVKGAFVRLVRSRSGRGLCPNRGDAETASPHAAERHPPHSRRSRLGDAPPILHLLRRVSMGRDVGPLQLHAKVKAEKRTTSAGNSIPRHFSNILYYTRS
jgi:hypothetical protein